MNIKDTCKCGAEFSVDIPRDGYTLCHVVDKMKEAHAVWLKSHESCREQPNPALPCPRTAAEVMAEIEDKGIDVQDFFRRVDGTYTIEEIKEYLSGWEIAGSEADYMLQNAINQIRDPEDGIAAVTKRVSRNKKSSILSPDFKSLYFELIMEVENKIPGEIRHETAKRIIRQHEQQCGPPEVNKEEANDETMDPGK